MKLQFANGKENNVSFSLGDETIFSSVTEDWIKKVIPDDLCAGTYNIGFGRGDETQFYAENAEDLRELWKNFCKENNIFPKSMFYCEYVEVKRNLEISIVLTSSNTFDVQIYEPETGDYSVVRCHDTGDSVQDENERVMREIRSWVSILREMNT